MGSQLPRQLKAFNVYIDGTSYAGRADNATRRRWLFKWKITARAAWMASCGLSLACRPCRRSL